MFVSTSLTSNEHRLLLSAVHQPHDGPSLRIHVLHFGAVPKVEYGHLTPRVAHDKFAFPEGIKTEGLLLSLGVVNSYVPFMPEGCWKEIRLKQEIVAGKGMFGQLRTI